MALWAGVSARETGQVVLWVFCGVFALMIVVILSFISNLEDK